MSGQPTFSVLIPTRQRHDTLKHSMQSVMNQNYKDFELIIMDNHSSSETFEVVSSFGKDERIRYYRANERLAMSDNWELGLSHVQGEYIFVLGDDDGLMPDGMELAWKLINQFDIQIVSWFRYQYWWSSAIVPWMKNRLHLNLTQLAEMFDSKEILRLFYESRAMFEHLPMVYNSFVHKSVIAKVKSVYGRYFMTHTPDVESGIVNAYFSEKYLYSFRALSIAGLSGHSTGTSQGYSSLNNNSLKEFKKEYKKDISREIHSSLTQTSSNQEIYVADVQLKVKELYFPNDKIDLDIYGLLNLVATRINRDSGLYEKTLQEIKDIAKKHNIDISKLNIPPKSEESENEAYQGPIYNSDGSFNTLIINCEQLGIFDVAKAALVCQGILPSASYLRVKVNPIVNEKDYSQISSNIKTPTIVVDGVFFQMYRTGIARVWRSLLEVWAENGFAEHIIVLDRVGTAPKIAGVRYRTIPAYDYNNTDADRQMLQQVCDEEGADIFVSTYYTTPISTPSVFMAYDMIPEVIGYDVSDPMWREKRYGINHASSYISISQNTANDLARLFTNIPVEEVTVAHCGVDLNFIPATLEEIANFKYRYGITKPYFLLVGAGGNYKNAGLFFQAFSQLATKQGFDIVCTGTGINLGNEYREYIVGTVLHPLMLSDEELRLAYAGAIVLVYPSKYEGFGMPVAEAMACGCPVITCPNSSLPEVAGEASIYVNDSNVDELVDALCEVQKPSVRNSLIMAGLTQAKKFSWQNMAEKVSQALIEATLLRLNLRGINLIVFPNWSQSEEVIFAELSEVIKTVASHPEQNSITLLIDNSNIAGEEADLILSSILMNLMMEEEIDVTEILEIVLIGELSDIQWQVLIPKLKARIILESENQEQISQVKLADLMAIKTDDIVSYNFDG